MATGCARGAVVSYDLLTGELVSRLVGHNSCVRDFAYHPNSPLLASASWDGRTLLWRYDERRLRNINPEAEKGDVSNISGSQLLALRHNLSTLP